jgi:WD40 repeat protein/ABC-type iron transport system FetAB ATPase subunit
MMMGAELPRVRVFLSSPADVAPERDIAERAVVRLAGIWKDYLRLELKRWERDHYEAVRSFQAAIGEMAEYDIFIGILWKRIGTSLPVDEFRRPDGSPYESGTVFEIEMAIASGAKQGRPKVYVFRSTAPVLFAAETAEQDQRQYALLQQWWNRTFRDTEGHFPRGFQTYADLDEFESSLEALLEKSLRDGALIPAGPAWDIDAKGSPYPGLVPYDASNSAVFFGRALAAASAIDELNAAAKRGTPAIFVIGPSGSGKSSLARAGLAPRFSEHAVPGVDFWRQVLLEPAEDPLLLLAQRLYAADVLPELHECPQPTPESFAAIARQSPEAAAYAIKWALDRVAGDRQRAIGGGRLPVGRLLVTLDQMETVLDHPEQRVIAKLLRALVDSETTWLIATLRSDRYPDFQLDPDFLELRRRGALFDLPPPGPSEIADVIVGPARAANLVFEERDGVSLSKVIRAAVTDADALPLLQMTLKRLFDARVGNMLTYQAYTAMGGLEGAIAAHAEDVFDAVSQESRARLDGLLRSLVADIDDNGHLTMRALSRSTIANDEASRALVDRMTEARLLVGTEGSIRVAHEALLRRWKRATESPALQPEAIRLRRQIEPNVEIWRKTGLDADLLQPGTTLAAAESIARRHPGVFPPELDDYVKSSVEAAQTRANAEAHRARWRASAASLAALVLAVLAVVSLRLYREASGNFELALLTKADRLLVDQKPTQARVVAGALRSSSLLERMAELVGIIDRGSDKSVRIRTIAEITSRASSVPLRTLKNAQAATAGALAPDGKRFAVGYVNGEVIIAPTDGHGKEIHRRTNSGRIWNMQFGPDGKWLMTASFQEILLWNLQDNKTVVVCDPNASAINAVAFDPLGRFLGWATRDGRVSVRQLASAQTQSFTEHTNSAVAIEFSRDGQLLASAGDDGSIVVRRVSDWAVVATIPTGRLDLFSISFSKDATRIASASLSGPVEVWSLKSERPETTMQSIAAPPDKRWRVKFSPDGRFLALASWQGTVGLWDAQTYQYRGTIDGNDHRVNDVSFSADASLLLAVVENGTARVWDLRTLQPMFNTFTGDRRETIVGKYSPDGTKFIAGGRDGVAKLFRVDQNGDWHFICGVDHRNWVIGAAFSGDSRQIATIAIADGRTAKEDVIKIWQTDTCKVSAQSVNPEHAYVQSIAFHPKRPELVWATRQGDIWVAELGGALKRTQLPKFHSVPVDEMDFSPDGKTLVSGDRSGKVAVWNMETRSLDRELRGHRQGVYTIKVSPDGKTIASAGSEERILIWDLTRPKGEERVRELPLPGGANRLAFNAKGTMLAVGTDTRYVTIWSTLDFKRIFYLGALVGVRSVYGFHPGTGDLAFDGENGLIRVLPNVADLVNRPVHGRLDGMDVSFDNVPVNVASDAEIVPRPDLACTR